MVLWVAVNEADIGNIKPGQPVKFTVDAFPGRTFKGEVSKVRLNASMTSNVVTYTVEVTTDNSSGTLLPYLTANVQFEVTRRGNVLAAPNAALRFMPSLEQMAPDVREAQAAPAEETRPRGRRERAATQSAEAHDSWRDSTLWIRDGRFARPIHVRAGVTDGASTEVDGDELKEGMEVIVSAPQAEQGAGAAAPTNPFQPRMPGGSRGGRSPR